MIKSLADLQRFLNKHTDARLIVDGRGGPKTRAAILNGFVNRDARRITPAEIRLIANCLSGTERQVQAVAQVESGGSGWNRQDQPVALFERHYAWRRLRIKIPFLSNPVAGGYTIDADQDGLNDSWEKLADLAMQRGPVVAFESASFGRFQVMGAHWKALGYEGPVEMAYTLRDTELAHYEMLARFINVKKLDAAFRALSADWRTNIAFARGYNGPKQKGYDRQLAEAMQ